MGGFGSNRWEGIPKRTAVEECLCLGIKAIPSVDSLVNGYRIAFISLPHGSTCQVTVKMGDSGQYVIDLRYQVQRDQRSLNVVEHVMLAGNPKRRGQANRSWKTLLRCVARTVANLLLRNWSKVRACCSV
jgi:hypothetical protein